MPIEATILVERKPPVATVTLHRPEALNALTRDMLLELDGALVELGRDDEIRVVVLTGSGRAFSAGVDLKALQGRPLTAGGVGDFLDLPARSVIDNLTTMAKVVIAKVNGFCFTGALELALACDLIVAADEAKFGDTHAKWGLRPTWGMSQRLIRLAGISRARELSYTARNFSGAEAAEWGIAVRSVPLADLDQAVTDLAELISANSPGSMAAYKDLYRHALDSDLSGGLAYESSTSYEISDTAERLSTF